MLVLLMAMSVIIGCHDRMCRSFLSGCVLLSNRSFWPCCLCGFLTFPCLWEISFSGSMIVELSVVHWT